MRDIKNQVFLLTVVVLLTLGGATAYSEEVNTNYFAAVNREVDLSRSLFVETNSEFDEMVCASLGVKTSESVEVRYLQVTFIFFYPNTNDVGPASSEMDVPYQLVDRRGHLSRVETATNEAPLNYIRVFDATKSKPTVELRIFVAVIPLDRERSVRYLHRSFQSDYDRVWKPLKEMRP
jgi:hypothetical protein